MNKKMILSAISMLLVFSMVAVLFTGCDSSADAETTTEVTYTAEELPTDITTLVDDESYVFTDTRYTPEQLEANTDKIFEYVNRKMNELADDTAKVKMGQSKGIGSSSIAVELTAEEQKEAYELAKNAVVSSTEEFDNRKETANERIEAANKKIAEAQEAIKETEEALAKAEAAKKEKKIKELKAELETNNKTLEYGQLAKADAEYELEKIEADRKAAEAFNGQNFEVLTPDQYEMVCEFLNSEKGYIITRRLDGTYFLKKYEGVPMTGSKNEKGEYENRNEYIETAIKSLDSYMLHADGFETVGEVKVGDYIPCAGKDYVLALTREDVKSATCVDKDGQREIVLTLKGHEFSDEIEQEIVEKAYNIETVKNPEILKMEEDIGKINDRIDEANEKIEAADKAITKAEKKKMQQLLKRQRLTKQLQKLKRQQQKLKRQLQKSRREMLSHSSRLMKTLTIL